MAIYDQIRAYIEQLGGGAGAFGSLNVNGGTEIKIKYKPLPASGHRVISVVPYLIGSGDPNSTTLPPLDDQRLMTWQYDADPGHPAPPAWRCFKVGQIVQLLPSPKPRPTSLPVLDESGQNCVRSW